MQAESRGMSTALSLNATALSTPIACASNMADTVWLSMSTILVLGMIPGLAFFEAGLLQSKNLNSIITQVLAGVSLLSFMWYSVGYSLTFSGENPIVGDFSRSFFLNLRWSGCFLGHNVSEASFALFQMMFAAITPLLLTGAVAERMKFRFVVALMVLWELVVYYPLARWIFNPNGFLARLGVLDFAGGIVIHASAGIASLAAAHALGPRAGLTHGHPSHLPYSNLPLASVGSAFLWLGWFGFNAGSALSMGPVAVHTIVNTQVAATVCGVTWTVLAAVRHRPSAVAAMNGVVAVSVLISIVSYRVGPGCDYSSKRIRACVRCGDYRPLGRSWKLLGLLLDARADSCH